MKIIYHKINKHELFWPLKVELGLQHWYNFYGLDSSYIRSYTQCKTVYSCCIGLLNILIAHALTWLTAIFCISHFSFLQTCRAKILGTF